MHSTHSLFDTPRGALRKPFAALVAAFALVLASCSNPDLGGIGELGKALGGGPSGELSIVAATELKILDPVLEEAEKDLGFDIVMESPDGTLANSHALNSGEFDGQYDATWFATNRYADLIGAGSRLQGATSIARSPVVLGVQSPVAREKGWDTRQPTWQEIADSGVTFGMTDPTTSNSGLSALAAVTTAFADTGRALNEGDIAAAGPRVHHFFQNQTLTSGSSGWLADRFMEDPTQADALINYESVLLGLKDQGADITVVVPADGVISADYPLATLATPKNADAGEKVAKLTEWLSAHEDQLAAQHLRTESRQHSQPVFELPYPGSLPAVQALQAAYSNDLRKPGSTVFALDTSGSMQGERIAALQRTMISLIDGTAAGTTGSVAFRNRERVTLLPFATEPYAPTYAIIDSRHPGSVQPLIDRVNGFHADGFTSIFATLRMAYETIDVNEGAIGSIVLMSDGEATRGGTFAEFRDFYNTLPAEKQRVPVFVILYGEANVAEMRELAELTGGATFDALGGDLAAAFEEIRAYQ